MPRQGASSASNSEDKSSKGLELVLRSHLCGDGGWGGRRSQSDCSSHNIPQPGTSEEFKAQGSWLRPGGRAASKAEVGFPLEAEVGVEAAALSFCVGHGQAPDLR